MDLQPDFKDLLKLFNSKAIEYVVVGAYALAFHGSPRYTGDIYLYVRPSQANAEKILVALAEFGFGSLGLSAEDFTSLDNVIQLGVPPVRVDILTSISGVDWETVQNGRELGTFGELEIPFIGREDYISNKRATGRMKDLADIEAIGG